MFVVCYDISCDKKRLKLMKMLKKVSFHVQKSVFEFKEEDYKEIKDLLDDKDVDFNDRYAIIRLKKDVKIIKIGKNFEEERWVL